MYQKLIYIAYGWLVLTGVLHFVVDVLSQYLRGKRAPSPETTLYYGLNSAFSLGQVAVGLLGLMIAWRASSLLSDMPVLIVSIAAGLGWFAITLLFMEYTEPRFNAGVFLVLMTAVVVAHRFQ